MTITLNNLCKYAKENYGMKLICGEENMNNLVNWVHMLEDPETAGFLHGQELIFSTGIGHENTDWFVGFAQGLVEHQASGLVLNLGPYIRKVPEDLIDYCTKVKLPLFTIPWKTRIVDITNDFCRKIIKAEENEVTVAGAFRDAIFFPDKISEYGSVLERKEFDLNASFCIISIGLKDSDSDKFSEFDKNIRLNLTKIFFEYSDRFNIFRQDRQLIGVLQDFPIDVIKNSLDRFGNLLMEGKKKYKIYAGISANENGIMSLSKNYKRAMGALRIAQKQNKLYASYDGLGFYQLLLEVEDTKVLERFYKNTLGELEAYDEKNDTDLSDTLKSYLEHNSSVQEVAQETYVHRNTVNYKIKKIKEILHSDLNYQESLQILLAMYIKELL